MATTKTQTPQTQNEIPFEDCMTRVTIPLLPEGEGSGKVDQTVMVQCDGKNHGRPLLIKRGISVEIPIWAFEILVHSGEYPQL